MIIKRKYGTDSMDFEYSGTEEEFVKERLWRSLFGLIDGSPSGVVEIVKRDLDLTFPDRYTYSWSADMAYNDDATPISGPTSKKFIYYVNILKDGLPYLTMSRDFVLESKLNLPGEWEDGDPEMGEKYKNAILSQYDIKLLM